LQNCSRDARKIRVQQKRNGKKNKKKIKGMLRGDKHLHALAQKNSLKKRIKEKEGVTTKVLWASKKHMQGV